MIKKTRKTTKLKPHDLIAVLSPSHGGLFSVVETFEDGTVIVRDPEVPGSSFRVGRDDIQAGPWRPIWHR